MNPIILNNFSRRNEFIKMLKDRGAKWGVEVGTDHGVYAKQLLDGIPGLFLYCVDPFTPYTEGNEVHTEEEMESISKAAYDRIYDRGGELMVKTSMEAVKNCPNNSLDFVFIDGNHSYEFVKEDIEEWSKKVKPGGIVAGHDYKVDPVNNYGVIEAVNEYVEKNHINPFFIMQKRGLVDCWMYIKS